ncbi:hypothetical protein PG994_015395 [Apiospora phragmitis]|uniref:Uncharacterized protein n=1 Tax=Apiospora phragmitis TaxID=2905665 RepID=A0ABR1SRE0_9PEZI
MRSVFGTSQYSQDQQATGSRATSSKYPVVTEAEKTHGSAARLYEAQGHHFFTSQLVVGARAYSLHSILHDRADAESVQIHEHLRFAVRYSSFVGAAVRELHQGRDYNVG